MMKTFRVILVSFLLALIPSFVLAATFEVTIDENGFNPPGFTINKGDTVRWSNNGTLPHSVTSGTNGIANGYFDSGLLNPGETFEFTFMQPAPDYAHVLYFDGSTPSNIGAIGVDFVVAIAPGNSVLVNSESLTLMFVLSPTSRDARLSIYFDGVLIYQENSLDDLGRLPGAISLGADPGIAITAITLPPFTLPTGLHTLSVIARRSSTGEVVSSDTVVYTVLSKSHIVNF